MSEIRLAGMKVVGLEARGVGGGVGGTSSRTSHVFSLPTQLSGLWCVNVTSVSRSGAVGGMAHTCEHTGQ